MTTRMVKVVWKDPMRLPDMFGAPDDWTLPPLEGGTSRLQWLTIPPAERETATITIDLWDVLYISTYDAPA